MWLEDEADPRGVDPGGADSLCAGLRGLLRLAGGVLAPSRAACCQAAAAMPEAERRQLWQQLRAGGSDGARAWAAGIV